MVRGALPVAAFIATRSTDLADMSDWYKTDIRTPHEKNEVKKNRHFFMSGPYKTALKGAHMAYKTLCFDLCSLSSR